MFDMNEFRKGFTAELSFIRWLDAKGDVYTKPYVLAEYKTNMNNREYEDFFWKFFEGRVAVSLDECMAFELAVENYFYAELA